MTAYSEIIRLHSIQLLLQNVRVSAASRRFDATHGQASSGHAGELETGRRWDHFAGDVGGRSQTEIARRLEDDPALPADCSPVEVALRDDGRKCASNNSICRAWRTLPT
jgi:hypothetical protein